MQQQVQPTNQERIRSNLKITLNLEITPNSGQIIQLQESIFPQEDSKEMALVSDQRKFGKNRLKMIINFTEEEQLKPVIQQGEILKAYRSFEQKYKLGDKVGEGAHAIVRKATKYSKNKIVTSKIYAVKIFRSGDPEIINTIKKTYNNSRFLNHPSIAAAIELFINEKTENAYLVMEYCPFPSLEDVIKKFIKLPELMIHDIAHDLLIAVGYIHQKGICHRDIKPDNILIDDSEDHNLVSQSKIKLVDFGVSKRFLQIIPGKVGSQSMDMWTSTGNIHYCAPEIYTGGGYNSSVDVWAVGVVLYQCLTGCLPFHENSQMDTIEAIGNENGMHFQAKGFKDASKNAKDFIKRLLKTDPKQRITVEEALEHPFITFTHNNNRQKSDSFKSRDDGDLQSIAKLSNEMLTKSSQMGGLTYKKNQQSPLQYQITEVVEELSPTTNAQLGIAKNKKQLEDKLVQFKEDTQLTTIYTLKRPEEFGQIDLVASFNTYANTNLVFDQLKLSASDMSIQLPGGSLQNSSEYDVCEDHIQSNLEVIQSEGFEYQIQDSLVLSDQETEKSSTKNAPPLQAIKSFEETKEN